MTNPSDLTRDVLKDLESTDRIDHPQDGDDPTDNLDEFAARIFRK